MYIGLRTTLSNAAGLFFPSSTSQPPADAHRAMIKKAAAAERIYLHGREDFCLAKRDGN